CLPLYLTHAKTAPSLSVEEDVIAEPAIAK
ncbi:formate/nitrite transporter family protein, partial [Vibrio sp. 1069]|nr:formate/nitrite transporter family protein [Vibrio sp. 1069]